ncbi:MAG: polyprenyl synthetase family protein [Bacillota bacterium]
MSQVEDLEKYRSLLDDALYQATAHYATGVESIKDAMAYAVEGGKRLRGATVLAVAEDLGSGVDKALGAALAVEMVHAYSLVHDDLPCMDDDDFRRGKPSCHKKFGEALALLAGDALLTAAFEIIATYGALPLDRRTLCVRVLAQAAGPGGMVAGQVVDLALEGRQLGPDAVTFMYSLKTGALFGAAAKLGALAANASEDILRAAESWGKNFGLAFQIIDDIDDLDEGGKESVKDTVIKEVSLDYAVALARSRLDDSLAALGPFGGKGNFLRELSLRYLDKIK